MNVNSIRSSSVDPWSSHDDDTQPPAAPAAPALPRDASAIPELPDVHAGLLAKAAQTAQATPRPSTPQAASTPHPLLATGLKAADVAPIVDASKTHVIMARLDAFLQSATPTYHIPGEGDVAVAVPFRMDTGQPVSPRLQDECLRVARSAGISSREISVIQAGRGSPQAIARLTQALLDAGKLSGPLYDGDSMQNRVRRMMGTFGIGLDCAGYVQQAFLAAHATTRAAAGLNPDITLEDLSLGANSRYGKVAPEKATAGDIIALDHPERERVGHRLVVYDQHPASAADLQALRGTAADMERMRSGQVSILYVDSSFGSGGNAEWGGVLRKEWVYDSSTNRWGTIEHGSVSFTDTGLPYDGRHPLMGVYHPRAAATGQEAK